MKRRDDIPMYDDPNEPAFVRELLHAGRRADAEYDVERGLAEHLSRISALHLSRISASASVSSWTTAAAAKSALPAWLGYVALPLAAAGVAAALWFVAAAPKSNEPAALPGASDTPAPAVVPQASPDTRAAPQPASAEHSDLPSQAASERRVWRVASRLSHSGARASQRSAAPARGLAESAQGSSEVEAIAPDTASVPVTDVAGPAANPYVAETASARAREPEAKAVEAREPEPAQSAAEHEEPQAAKPAAKAAPTLPVQPVQPVVDEARLEREMQMLAVTQRVLGSDPQRALRLAQQGEREFPSSMFSAERRQLALLAMVKLGRLDEARRAGRPFLARYPNAPWSERLRRALATGHVE